MLLKVSVFLSVVFLCSGEDLLKNHPRQTRLPLKFPTKYYVKGTLYLPYTGIEEPFDAWFDGANHRSRIDMYDGKLRYN